MTLQCHKVARMSKTAVLGGYYWISIKVILETFADFRIVKGWDISVL